MVKQIIIFNVCLAAALIAPSLIKDSLNPGKDIVGWQIIEINEPIKVWNFASLIARENSRDTREVVRLIEEGNPRLKATQNYKLCLGDKILVPVFNK